MITNDGLELIKYFEGCKLKVYKDTNGFPTVGYGHLVLKEDNLKVGDEITEEDAQKYLKNDLEKAESKVDKYIYITIAECEKDALISQAFNLTTRSFVKLCSYLIQSRKIYVSKLLLYCKDSSGNTLEGLKRRREAEKLLFLGKKWDIIKMNY